MPRLALLLFCATYVLPGVLGRDPWRNADVSAFGVMASIAEGRSPWFHPTLGGVPVEGGLLPHWLGALSIQLLSPWLGAPLAARLPFALLLAATLALTWYAAFQLARTEAAQPLAPAFGGGPQPKDYARAMGDTALLALMACLGLLQLGHETTPELVQLFGATLYLWALAAAPYRAWKANLGSMLGLVVMAASGAPAMATMLGAAGVLVLSRSRYASARTHLGWAAGSVAVAAMVGQFSGSWAWRGGFEATLEQLWQLPRLWSWFLWPAWPLALWTLWRWRRHLTHRHIAVPLSATLVALVACVWMGGNDRALLMGLPGLAVLAAFALPTLRRSAAAAIDWLAMSFFTACALALWVVYSALLTGTPAKPAANVARLAEGYVAQFEPLGLVVAVLATLAWLALVRWRTGRAPEAVWKGLVLSAGGVALCWTLLMTLMLPLLDYARSQRPWVERLQPHLQGVNCVAAPGLGQASVAALEFHGRVRVEASRQAAGHSSCPVMLRVQRRGVAVPVLPGWTLQAQVRRPTERNELTLVYRRAS